MRTLQVYAADPTHSRGRRVPEPAPEYRSEFQRDRDRIIHSTAFRRLEYKTQVFVNHEGDLFRTRLTHTLEVAQIARTIARVLGLNEDLTEAITLAHDLGHTPFGHAGQDALNDCMRPYGGFEHNLQSLRVVDELEERYAEFAGLNLSFETREGILKHCSKKNARQLGALGERFINGTQPSLEAQLANLADEIAYNSHDVDDGLRAGFITVEEVKATALLGELFERVHREHPTLPARRVIYQVVRHMISLQVADLIEASRAAIANAQPGSIDDVRAQSKPLLRFSDAMRHRHTELKQFLFRNLYRHHRVNRMNAKSKRIIRELFDAFFNSPNLLPPQQQERADILETQTGEAGRARAVADYIAGMTDRFAIDEHEKLFDPRRLT
ncbi:deoxyguanosinetriphosphate triphosphohydrolase [Alkalilimnicola ehrlichii]|uniref:Deoxyguanosinetriphosphate triphosphohydrolase-like protein n=2 Tax=Alkalilimnicola ehrlichii TaxID=351052 RepID=A0A3E0X3N1_9GAMM|nr:deoxyguanosinetriphosphate triphosphohydrolase [Alkalilimnicola ehrlichii]RFA31479.1 deoxyguanosinetriphosphate triphosphohydrolase [Alkalilimnicola ehrlichii]RFA39648.1 deoxyguanosinetriphosphate triphosphohydrolase [Alkalilimnicola ehrlichii]